MMSLHPGDLLNESSHSLPPSLPNWLLSSLSFFSFSHKTEPTSDELRRRLRGDSCVVQACWGKSAIAAVCLTSYQSFAVWLSQQLYDDFFVFDPARSFHPGASLLRKLLVSPS